MMTLNIGPNYYDYQDREERLKQLYYKSNPLRKFVGSTHGQSILPAGHKNAISNKKKGLPKIFSELRVNDLENDHMDREAHKKGLRTALKLNLQALEIEKSPIDTLENSKKIYSEYCRHNLNKPLDTSNIESVFKSDFKRLKTRSNLKKHKMTPNLNSTLSHHTQNTHVPSESVSSDESSTFRMPGSKKSADLEINAHTVKLKDLQDMNKEKKCYKAHMAKAGNVSKIYPKCSDDNKNRAQIFQRKYFFTL